MENTYDSKPETKKHIDRVRRLLFTCIKQLFKRGEIHDQTKLNSPEKEIFDEYTPKLKGSTYGSDEYKSFLEDMGVALKHHYGKNSHHPEYYENGIYGMNLLDLIEMLCDWKAATERHDNGDIRKSLEINKKRFAIDDQLCMILENTVNYLEDLKWN